MADNSITRRAVPVVHNNETEHRRQLANTINGVLDGKINSVGEVTLTANDTTTTLVDIRIGARSVILLMPLTATAATALPNTYISTTKEQATITHDNTADTDRSFRYVVFGG